MFRNQKDEGKSKVSAKSGKWKRLEKDVAYIALFGYKLRNNVEATFATGELYGSPGVTYFRKTFFGHNVVSTGFWLSPDFRLDLGCFADVTGDGKHLSSFVLKTVVPAFVSKSLGYGKKEVLLAATTKIAASGNSEDFGTAESEVRILDKDGRVLDTLHDKSDAYPALIDSYKDFTTKSTRCD